MTARAMLFLATLCLAQVCPAQEPAGIPLRLQPAGHSAVVRDMGNGGFEVRTVGEDPYVLCDEIAPGYDASQLRVFSFDYICGEGLDFFEVFFIAPRSSWVNAVVPDISPATEWTHFSANVAAVVPEEWDGSVEQFRIDFGSGEGKTVRVRDIRLRPMNAAEVQAEAEARAAKERVMAELSRRVEAALVSPARIETAGNVLAATHALGDTHIAVVGKDLDLASQLREHADALDPAAHLPPRLVVGEGPDPENHTVVRLLNRHHICQVQFLAYPPEVTGGVRVCAGEIGGTKTIVTAPFAAGSVRELRLFDSNGNRTGSLRIADDIPAPFAIAVGDFADAAGDEIAVAPLHVAGDALPVLILSGAGRELARLEVNLPEGANGELSLSAAGPEGGAGGQLLLAYVCGRPDYYVLHPRKGTQETVQAGLGADCTGVYATADGRHVASMTEPEFSHLAVVGDGTGGRINVGERENLFWVTADGAFDGVPEGRYVKRSRFSHIRTDFGSPQASTPDFGNTDPEFWAGATYRDAARSRVANYDTDPPVCWEPCFTHRWFAGQASRWAEATDPETGLPAYVLVDRENETGYYGEFGATRAFVSGTYAPHVTPIDCFYTYPLRTFLRELAVKFRGNPEHFVAVEPNHEMEINAESETSHGDYNPNMIRGFLRYLLGLYGSLEGINTVFGTDFGPERFDAPRDLGRGEWDGYAESNPYYLVWMRYLNYVIYRVVAGTYREALLAGFPPEAIKCHQIPDHYAIASLAAFSKPARRITPIDWNLNAGVGFGCTKYGVWFNQEHNCVQGPHSSGFDATVIGEYQSLHPDADIAYQQLAYMHGHGVQFIHNMNWPEGHDRGYNASLAQALTRLAEEDRPRPGLTGGTGQVRAAGGYDIVAIGTGPEHTGLIKSITAEGDWEGSVYVVPFHSHVAIAPLEERQELDLSREPMVLGPFAAIDAGNLVEVSCLARGDDLTLRVLHHGIEMESLRLTAPVGEQWRHVRLLVRVQIDTDDLTLELASRGTTSLRELVAVRHSEQTTKLKKGEFAGRRHRGGVTFDVLGQ